MTLAPMDPYRLLSRSTKLRGGQVQQSKRHQTPSSGHNVHPQLFAPEPVSQPSKKRKRSHDVAATTGGSVNGLDFFGGQRAAANTAVVPSGELDADMEELQGSASGADNGQDDEAVAEVVEMSLDERRNVLKQHKLKVSWLNPVRITTKAARKDKQKKAKEQKLQIYPSPLRSFDDLKRRYGIAHKLAANISDQGYVTPTEVQLGALPLLLDSPVQYLGSDENGGSSPRLDFSDIDLLTVAPTGSGKTLAFMIPLMHKIQQRRRDSQNKEHVTTAIVLAPTKELVGQITNEGRKLGSNTGIRVSQLRKGMRLVNVAPTVDASAAGDGVESNASNFVVKADVLVCTPGVLDNILSAPENRDSVLASVQHLVLDEADVLLDPLFREQTLSVWNALGNFALRVSLWSATMGSNVEELARSVINSRREEIALRSTEDVEEAPLVRLVVGLKDSAVPSVEHKLVYAATEQGKLMGLRQLLHPAATPKDQEAASLRPPFLVFTQTIDRAVALHSELLYDIPVEAGGISRIAVLHSGLSDTARDSVMTRFRKGEVWVLITTDLLSRGVDFRGVNGVVNYDIPTSSAAYVHRVGRTGRAGREGGIAITLYSKEDIPYLKHVVNVVALSESQRTTSTTAKLQPWLLDALPTLNKHDKQKLKKRGIESKTSRGRESDSKAARKARISSKAGFVRRTENNRKGAVLGNQRRTQATATSDAADDTDFGGFD